MEPQVGCAAVHRYPALPVLDRVAEASLSLLAAPSGYVPASALAAALHAHERPTLWLRMGLEGRDPAALLISLIAAIQRLHPSACAATLDRMRHYPGPIAGWPALFGQLAQDLLECFGPNGALVLENCHYMGDASQTLRLLGTHLLSAMPAGVSCVLLADRPLPLSALPAGCNCWDAGDLGLKGKAAQRLAEQLGCSLPGACVRDAAALADGRGGALLDLCPATEVLGPACSIDCWPG